MKLPQHIERDIDNAVTRALAVLNNAPVGTEEYLRTAKAVAELTPLLVEDNEEE
jgi:hypothetical protein